MATTDVRPKDNFEYDKITIRGVDNSSHFDKLCKTNPPLLFYVILHSSNTASNFRYNRATIPGI
jgi:hypothetical protein